MIDLDWNQILRDAFDQVPIHPLDVDSARERYERTALILQALGVEAEATEHGIGFGGRAPAADNALIAAVFAITDRRFAPPRR